MNIKYAIAPNVSIIPPKLAYQGDSGFDLYNAENNSIILLPTERQVVRTGLYLEIPEGYEGQIRTKSGLASKRGLTVLNSPGTIDSGYRGEILVVLFNSSRIQCTVLPGEKIAQIVFSKIESPTLQEVNFQNFSVTARGNKGFGLSGEF